MKCITNWLDGQTQRVFFSDQQGVCLFLFNVFTDNLDDEVHPQPA